jgi:RimJ/RimL family protein N-acetyltransferase
MNDQAVATFTTKSGKEAIIRSVERDDVEDAAEFINQISKEDTFVQFSGEHVSQEDEQRYIDSELELIGLDDAVKLFCFIDGEMAGVADVHRVTNARKRKLHIGRFGLIIGKQFRGQGIGEELMRVTIGKAVSSMPGLKMIYLECFADNEPAQNLYKKVGFVEVGRVPGALYRQGEYVDEVIMILNV